MKSYHPPRLIILALLIIGLAGVMQCIGAWQDSQTTDEAVHLSAGRSYWQTGDFRLNPEHPPLIKLLAAAPLLLIPSTRIDTHSGWWQERQEWMVGITMLYGADPAHSAAQKIMFLGRLPMILVWAALGWLIFTWARKRWGALAGLLSLTAYSFDPNFLGHGHLVTTDLGLTLGFLATIWLLEKFLLRPSWSSLGWLSFVFALTQVTKFSAIILWVIVPLVALIRFLYRPATFSGQWWWRMLAGLVIVTSLVTWAVYGFEVKRINTDPRIGQLWQERQTVITSGTLSQQPPIVQKVIAWSDPSTSTGRFLMHASHWPVPAYSYWRGLFSTLSHDVFGHPAYLLGQTSMNGWWYYFPIALLVKTPSPTLILILVAGALGLWRLLSWPKRTPWSQRIPFSAWILGFPPVVFFAWSMTSHINIGLRHIFPVEPFLFLAIGSMASAPILTNHVARKKMLVGALGTLPLLAVLSWPNTIGYFSEIIGGPRQGYQYLLDSNLDWNQDIWRLRNFLQLQHFPEVHLVLFGSIPYRNIFPTTLPVLEDQAIASGQRPSGIVIISAGQLYNQDGPFAWLRSYRPQWRIGSSISVYDFR